MVSPTHLTTSPISSEGSTVLLSPDRDPSPGSPDRGGHTPTFPDRLGSPRHLGPVGLPTIAMGSPDRRPTRPSSPALELPSGSPDRGRYAPTADVTGHVPRISADDVRLTLATISYLWDREATFCSQADTIHALQQSYQDAVARGDRLQDEIDSLYRSAAPFVFFVQRRYDWMQGRYVNAVHSLSDCQQALRTHRDQSALILRLRASLRASAEDQGSLERQVKALRDQVQSLQAELKSLRQQRDQLTLDRSFLHTDVLHLKGELDRSQEEIADGLASISDLIQQVDCLTPLEGQLALSQMENANLRRQLAEHLTIHDQLQVAEQDRDKAVAEHRALLDTLNSAILGSRSSTLAARSTPRSTTPARSPPVSAPQVLGSLARKPRSRSFGPPAKRRRVQLRPRSRDFSITRSASRLLSLNSSAPSKKLPRSAPSEPSSSSYSSSPSFAASGTGSEKGGAGRVGL